MASVIIQEIKFNVTYVAGSASGTVDYETISLGCFEVINQVFGEQKQLAIPQYLTHDVSIGYVTETNGIQLATYGNSGIMGLAFSRAGKILRYSAHILMDNILGSLKEEDRFFSFKLGAERGESSFAIGKLSTVSFDFLTLVSCRPSRTQHDGKHILFVFPCLTGNSSGANSV